jgi:hypothetical protein
MSAHAGVVRGEGAAGSREQVAWIGVADAEDLFHPDLLRMVDYRIRRAGAGIVQCGVQLVKFSSDRSTPAASGWPAGAAAAMVEGQQHGRPTCWSTTYGSSPG